MLKRLSLLHRDWQSDRCTWFAAEDALPHDDEPMDGGLRYIQPVQHSQGGSVGRRVSDDAKSS